MTDASSTSIVFEGHKKQVSWYGICFSDEEIFEHLMIEDVTSRIHDEEFTKEYEKHLRSLALTGFGRKNLEKLLSSEVLEERDWAIGEAIAEVYIKKNYDVIWPWNSERDKKTPLASLPGADLVGFEIEGDTVRIVLGEVKTSSDVKTPPGIMSGRSGMIHQLDRLSSDLGIVLQLLFWLWPRCKGDAQFEHLHDSALTLYLNSGNKAVALFGVLIRDTEPNDLDLKNRGHALARILQDPTTCRLVAIYLPCQIESLPDHIGGSKV